MFNHVYSNENVELSVIDSIMLITGFYNTIIEGHCGISKAWSESKVNPVVLGTSR